MKAIFTLFLCYSFTLSSAQLSILFVDDSDDGFDNSIVFRDAVSASGFESILYNAPDSSSGPSVQYMSEFNLVIWHTSSVGDGLELWNGTDQDNENLKGYLDTGGMLWLVGLDFLFDRYGAPSDSFQAGDFVYDYLGLSSYDVQAYGGDGGLGVPELNPDLASPISGLNSLSWIFDTSWWVDGVTPIENAEVVYRMGDATYTFAEKPCGIYYQTGSFKTLTYLFDLAQVANAAMLEETVSAVLNHFNYVSLNVNSPSLYIQDLSIYPNPAQADVTLSFTLKESLQVSVEMADIQGKPIAFLVEPAPLSQGMHAIQLSVPASNPVGMYFLKINIGSTSMYEKLIIRGF